MKKLKSIGIALGVGLGVTLVAAVTPSDKRSIFLAGSLATLSGLAALTAKEAKDAINEYKKDTDRTRLEIAFDHLFTNQGGLVTLEQLRVAAKVDISKAAEFLSEQLKQHGASQVQGFGPNAFLFTNHPAPIIEQVEKNILERLNIQQQQQQQQPPVQPQPQGQPGPQNDKHMLQMDSQQIETIMRLIQDQEAALSREAWAANNGVPQQMQPQMPQQMPQMPMQPQVPTTQLPPNFNPINR